MATGSNHSLGSAFLDGVEKGVVHLDDSGLHFAAPSAVSPTTTALGVEPPKPPRSKSRVLAGPRDVRRLEWSVAGESGTLAVYLTSGHRHELTGFPSKDGAALFSRLEAVFRQPVHQLALCSRGINWGVLAADSEAQRIILKVPFQGLGGGDGGGEGVSQILALPCSALSSVRKHAREIALQFSVPTAPLGLLGPGVLGDTVLSAQFVHYPAAGHAGRSSSGPSSGFGRPASPSSSELSSRSSSRSSSPLLLSSDPDPDGGGRGREGSPSTRRRHRRSRQLSRTDSSTVQGLLAQHGGSLVAGPATLTEVHKALSSYLDTAHRRAHGLIMELPSFQVLRPRARFSLQVFCDRLTLVAKSTQSLIPYTSCRGLAVVQGQQATREWIVVYLTPPLRRGQNKFPHLVLAAASRERRTKLTVHLDALTSAAARARSGSEVAAPTAVSPATWSHRERLWRRAAAQLSDDREICCPLSSDDDSGGAGPPRSARRVRRALKRFPLPTADSASTGAAERASPEARTGSGSESVESGGPSALRADGDGRSSHDSGSKDDDEFETGPTVTTPAYPRVALVRALEIMTGHSVASCHPAYLQMTGNRPHGIPCTYQRAPGFLFPMRDHLLYLYQPTTLELAYRRVQSFSVLRYFPKPRSRRQRMPTFDLLVNLADDDALQFDNLPAKHIVTISTLADGLHINLVLPKEVTTLHGHSGPVATQKASRLDGDAEDDEDDEQEEDQDYIPDDDPSTNDDDDDDDNTSQHSYSAPESD